MLSICNDWRFSYVWNDALLRGEGGCPVRLPHTVSELPLHYARPEQYETVCGYCRVIHIPDEYAGKRIFLQLDGAAHIATVYCNGVEAGTHRCGYTAFRVELSALVRYGEDNVIAVKLDCTENPVVPPFGLVIDYLTYGGLYREAWLDVREQNYIEDIYIVTPSPERAAVKTSVQGEGEVRVRLLDGDKCIAEGEGADVRLSAPGARLWSVDSPNMYTCEAVLTLNGRELDRQRVSFGFRTVRFDCDSFYLNGEKLFLRGLNRHQSYPYIGYAAPEGLQRNDARILKRELRCSAVRTSHYPQSQHFIDECDRLGLLVFTELPGWQHVGDAAWKKQAVENLREMILQYRNHPSIFLWGVRINESLDDDAFYLETNALARELDPSRPTSGVRYLENSSFLEDVYSYNDFSHDGTTPGAKPKKSVMKDMGRPLIISEHNGHMFPTKAFDPWEKRQEQALRHARVLDAAMADGKHAGCFGWCMFDYPTHKDFGSGDRVCYHGVMDAFRNPKTAAALYASQGDEMPVLEIGSSMDIGDYPAGKLGGVFAFTNADEVELYKNGSFVKAFTPQGWKGLKHGPIKIDDFIGGLLESQEGFDKPKAEILRRCLCSAGEHGLANMPLGDKLRMAGCMLRYKLTMSDGVALFGKYVGNWGCEATKWRVIAKNNGEITASRELFPGGELHIEAKADRTRLHEGDTYDMAAVRIRILDETGGTAVYAQLPVRLELSGDAELVGPSVVTAEGGMCGTYIKTAGRLGAAKLIISADGLAPTEIKFEIGGNEDA